MFDVHSETQAIAHAAHASAHTPPPRSTFARIRRYVTSCFLLLVPILVWNLALTSRLPPAFQSSTFWREIPGWVGIPENVLRTLVMVLPVVMPLEIRTHAQRVHLVWFAAGVVVYFASWVALIAWPASAWSTSALGFLAPAYTPALWLFWLGALSDRWWFSRLPFRRWVYFVLAATFLVFHNLHAGMVYARTF